ncbi:hypothetical protein F4553_003590 [Allocatelliglobosispora scoriae]|uniref:CBM2 domain-containing protein n=1 Tax=Allocatelliglobosispora scoriae TaxID=643052 RepID=A0A841BTV6_9ACTN|nr:cellulose binding domain-containing protein [Allocatelliglobosispora scoriae]MBB5870211.1 hypothetical protein [Allocatelliglobosispora scoriae]
MGRHRAELEDAASAPDPAKAPQRSRIWANPVPLAAIGLIVAIGLVFGGWVLVGRDRGSPMVYPWTTGAPVPIDVMVTVPPTTQGPAAPSPSASRRSSRPEASSSPSVSPTPQSSMSASAAASPSPSPKPTEAGSTGALTVAFRVQNAWNGAFQGEFTVTNTGGQSVDTWVLRATFPSGLDIYGLWEARSCAERVTNQLVAVSVRSLGAGQTIKVGFLATFTSGSVQPNVLTVSKEPSGCPNT